MKRIFCLLLFTVLAVYCATIVELDFIQTEEGVVLNEIIYHTTELDPDVMKEIYGFRQQPSLSTDFYSDTDTDSEYEQYEKNTNFKNGDNTYSPMEDNSYAYLNHNDEI